MTIRVGIIGGRGYVGEELLGLLLASKMYEPVFVGSSTMAGKPIEQEYPNLPPNDLQFEELDSYRQKQDEADVWVLAQPNGCAGGLAGSFDDSSIRLIDISSDFRFSDDWTYGLPERDFEAIAAATRISNPGCYATGAQLALLPVLERIQGTPSVFGVSGYSGAGRKPNERNAADRIRDNVMPYQLAGHTHEREIAHHLGNPVSFLPHVGPFFRGISLTISVDLAQELEFEEVFDAFTSFYREFPLVKVTREIPEIRAVACTNECHIGGFTVSNASPKRLIMVSVLDNLRKGAASQVIQNMNLMFGHEMSCGLIPIDDADDAGKDN